VVGPGGEDGGSESIATLDLQFHSKWIDDVRHGNSVAAPPVFRTLYEPDPPVSTALGRLRERGLASHPSSVRFQAMLRGLGMNDCFGLAATHLDEQRDAFIQVAVPVPSALSMSGRTCHQLACVAAHLASAWRLRKLCGERAEPEAVFEVSGKLAHAEGAARERDARSSLARAVAQLDRARGRLRRTAPEEALGLWRGLVEGRWSLVDTVESDGRRLILARRNEPRVRDPRALTGRERQVLAQVVMGRSNKYIAYSLGLSASTVATHLDSARRKLGAGSRRELIRMFAPASRPPPSR
jgi:DNA-binding CsgD family transcriptional regulator